MFLLPLVPNVSSGEYVFDPRAANVSVNGQTFAEWYTDEYLFGPTAAGNPDISGFYFDDRWKGPAESRPGPSEMDLHAVVDMGLSPQDLVDVVAAFDWVQDKAYAALLDRGKFSWNQLWNGDRTPWIDCPDPIVTQDNCSADIRSLCSADSLVQKHAMLYAFSPGCHCHTKGTCQSNASWNNFTDPEAGVDEGLPSLSLSNLLYMENPYSYRKCQ
jgi:hypothetical protein